MVYIPFPNQFAQTDENNFRKSEDQHYNCKKHFAFVKIISTFVKFNFAVLKLNFILVKLNFAIVKLIIGI